MGLCPGFVGRGWRDFLEEGMSELDFERKIRASKRPKQSILG